MMSARGLVGVESRTKKPRQCRHEWRGCFWDVGIIAPAVLGETDGPILVLMMHSRRNLLVRAGALAFAGSGAALLSACGSTKKTSRLGAPLDQDPVVLRPNVPPRERVHTQSNRLPPPPRVTAGSFAMPSYIIDRTQWATFGPRVSETKPMGRINRITVHHDGMRVQTIRTSSQAARKLENIRRAHVANNGWADIGYHAAIDPQGRVWQGRPWHLQGAHVRDQNQHNLGILVMGNFQRERPTAAAMNALERLLIDVSGTYHVSARAVFGHRDLAPTACPGKFLVPRLAMIRDSGRFSGIA
jgi:N-acetylmuramoyl-L-alanine amidase